MLAGGSSCKCNSLSGGSNYTVHISGTKCGDVAIFECAIGWYMAEGGQQRTAVCLYGNWTVTTVQCLGKALQTADLFRTVRILSCL